MIKFFNIALTLAYKDFQIDWRRKSALGSILLYVVATVFICFLSFRQMIDLITWNTLHWIIILFASINTVAKSFIQESSGRMLYYHLIAKPAEIIAGKLIYNSLLSVAICVVNLLVYSLFMGNPVGDSFQYLIVLLLAAAGFSFILSMTSAIAAKSNQGATIMSVLSMPLLIPMLIVIIRASKNAADGIQLAVNGKYLLILGTMDVLILALVYLLFPYLWKE